MLICSHSLALSRPLMLSWWFVSSTCYIGSAWAVLEIHSFDKMVHIMQNFLFAVIVVGAVVLSTARCAPLQQEADKVTALPGQPPVGFSLYAGNVTVDEVEGKDLFYVFAECSNDTLSTKPLVLWLNGGKIHLMNCSCSHALVNTLHRRS